MEAYQKKFIRLCLEKQVLRFGEFKLKSGRISPYFFNSGLFNDGGSLGQLGDFYMDAICHNDIDFDMLYGPAYKGILLASATAIAFSRHHHIIYPFCFNRKEVKDHGEGGNTFGAPINGKVLIIDDVISAGTSIHESVNIIHQANGTVAGALVALNRQERGLHALSAIEEIEQKYQIPVISIINLDQIIAYLDKNKIFAAHLDAMRVYKLKYSCC